MFSHSFTARLPELRQLVAAGGAPDAAGAVGASGYTNGDGDNSALPGDVFWQFALPPPPPMPTPP